MMKRLWMTDRPLTAGGLLTAAFLPATLLGLVLDPRLIAGAPAWLKPAKFAASTAIYMLTLAWIFTYLPQWPRLRRLAGRTTAIVLVGEVALIAMQAWRGEGSHFNLATRFDAAVFNAMGLGILLQTLSSIAVAVAVWRQAFEDRPLGWALRLGLSITIAGAMMGGLMTAPTTEQLDKARLTKQMPVSGAHTVGAPDGGPGLPGTGWSTTHGDLRVPHFVGLHAMQALPLLAVGLRRRGVHAAPRTRLVVALAASYASLYVVLLSQALRGQSIVSPDAATAAALAAWAGCSAGAVWYARRLRAVTAPEAAVTW